VQGGPGRQLPAVEGATCDRQALGEVSAARFQCTDVDYVLIVGSISGGLLIALLLIVIVIVFSCAKNRRRRSGGKFPCDYLQYVPCEEEAVKDGGLSLPPHLALAYGGESGRQLGDGSPGSSSGGGTKLPQFYPGGHNHQGDSSMYESYQLCNLQGGDTSRMAYLADRPATASGRRFHSGAETAAMSRPEEPLYYTVTTNPLEEYSCGSSSGYHGSNSEYANSSTSSDRSTALVPPPPPPSSRPTAATASLFRAAGGSQSALSSPARTPGSGKRRPDLQQTGSPAAGSSDQFVNRFAIDWLPADRQSWFTVGRCPDILKHSSQNSHHSYLV
jgi:hypothetical protein